MASSEQKHLDVPSPSDNSSAPSPIPPSTPISLPQASVVKPAATNELFSDAFLREIPKVDLHLHLDGSVRLETLLELAAEQKVKLPASTPAGLRETVFKDTYKDLPEYLLGFGYINSVLRRANALERVAYELAVDNFAEGVRYIEVRFAPQLHVDASAPADHGVGTISEVLCAVNRGLERAEKEWNERPQVKDGSEPGYHYGIIVCALRMINEFMSPYYKCLCEMHKHEEMDRQVDLAAVALVTASVQCHREFGVPVVALDVAGAEKGFPAEWLSEAFKIAQKHFLKKTVHAGEGYGPQSIYQAITDLQAERIGHGFHLFSWKLAASHGSKPLSDDEAKDYVRHLAEYIADRRITLEVCLTSNLQTMPELQGLLSNHNLRHMIDHNISVTLATDNRLVSNTDICREYRLAVDHFQMTRAQLRQIAIAGFKRSFWKGSYKQKRAYTRQVIDYYDKIESEHFSDGAPVLLRTSSE